MQPPLPTSWTLAPHQVLPLHLGDSELTGGETPTEGIKGLVLVSQLGQDCVARLTEGLSFQRTIRGFGRPPAVRDRRIKQSDLRTRHQSVTPPGRSIGEFGP